MYCHYSHNMLQGVCLTITLVLLSVWIFHVNNFQTCPLISTTSIFLGQETQKQNFPKEGNKKVRKMFFGIEKKIKYYLLLNAKIFDSHGP